MKNVSKLIKILLDIIIWILIIILFGYLCLTIYQKLIKKNDLVSFNNYYLFQIASSSMENKLHVGDYIVVKKVDDYKIGDVITFKSDNLYITHRICNIQSNSIITKGDANNSLDEPLKKEDILGKVLFKANILTFIVKYKVYIIVVVLALLFADSIWFNKKNSNILE